MKKWQIAIKNFLSPLPDPKIEVNKYWILPFPHLTGHQLELIITMVIKEAKVSREFGLFIRPKDLEKEISFWLTFVNNIGPDVIRSSEWRQIWNLATATRDMSFGEIGQYYFDLISNSKPKITNANTAFHIHLEGVQTRILTAIYNNNFPLA